MGGLRAGARGFSLLEVLLAASLGVLVAAALVQLFAATSRGNVLLSGEAALQESVRHAFDILARSARNAGYLGCAAGVPIVNGLNGDWDRLAEVEIVVAVEGFDGVGEGNRPENWNPTLSALPLRGVDGTGLAFKLRNRIATSGLRPGSDVIVFRRVEAPVHPLAEPWRTGSDPLTVIIDEDFALAADDFALVSGCGQGILIRIGADAAVGRTTLSRPTGSDVFDNRPGVALFGSLEPFGDEDRPVAAAVARIVTEVYFVAQGSGTGNRGGVVWSLWRKTSTDRAVELVQGIEDMQVLFGVDAIADDGSSAPTRHVPPGSSTDPVRTVRVSLVASSVDVVTADDRVLSRRFSRTLALRNR